MGVNQPGRHSGALLAELLAEHGVRHVFGVPGGQTLALVDTLTTRDLAGALAAKAAGAAYLDGLTGDAN